MTLINSSRPSANSAKHRGYGTALNLVHAIGLPDSSGRFMPRLLVKPLGTAPAIEAARERVRRPQDCRGSLDN